MTTARTNLGPLTTTFSYPASCSAAVKYCSTCDFAWQAQTCSNNIYNYQGAQDDPGCWPPRSDDDSIETEAALQGWGYYSPGLACPLGYTTACSTTGGVSGGFQFQFQVLSTETVVGCCPTGYTCAYEAGVDYAQTCFRYMTTGSIQTAQCVAGTATGLSYVTIPQTLTAAATEATASSKLVVVVVSKLLVYAPLIQLNYASTDVRSVSTVLIHKPPTSTAGPTTPGATSTSDSNSNSTSADDSATVDPVSAGQSSGGISTGAQAGIGVACGLVGLLLIGALVWWWRRRRAQNHQQQQYQHQQQRPGDMPPSPYDTMPHIVEAPNERDTHEVEAKESAVSTTRQQQQHAPYGHQQGYYVPLARHPPQVSAVEMPA